MVSSHSPPILNYPKVGMVKINSDFYRDAAGQLVRKSNVMGMPIHIRTELAHE